MLRKEEKRAADDPGLDRIARAAVRYDFPLNILCWDNLDAGIALIDRHPDTRFIVDHLGILQPRVPPAPAEPCSRITHLHTVVVQHTPRGVAGDPRVLLRDLMVLVRCVA